MDASADDVLDIGVVDTMVACTGRGYEADGPIPVASRFYRWT